MEKLKNTTKVMKDVQNLSKEEIQEQLLQEEWESVRPDVVDLIIKMRKATKFFQNRLREKKKDLHPQGLLYEYVEDLRDAARILCRKANCVVNDLTYDYEIEKLIGQS